MCALWESEDPLREAVIINHKVKLVPKFPDLPSTWEIFELGKFFILLDPPCLEICDEIFNQKGIKER